MSSSGPLQIEVLRTSSGPQVQQGDRIWVWYAGELEEGGAPFDANFDFASFSPVSARNPFSFILGAGQVIQGWDQGLRDRRLGEVLELTIPSALAYGSAGSPPRIPANADLRFTVELLAISDPGGYTFPTWNDLDVDLRPAAALGADLNTYPSQTAGLDGNDTLLGTTDNDLLAGLDGDDTLGGLEGNDLLLGGNGSDQLSGGDGDDILDGGDGTDSAVFGSADNTVNLSLTAPQQTGEGLDSLVSIESVDAGEGNDQITGNSLANTISGGKGSDQLSGGAGADQFVYSQPTDSSRGRSGRDTITDFNGREGDRIELATIDANALLPGNQAFRFIGTQPFAAGRPGDARFTAGLLQLNIDASKRPEMAIELSAVSSLQGRFLIL